MDLAWLVRLAVSHWAASLLVLGVGVVVAVAGARNWKWTVPLVYGLSGSAAVAILLHAVMCVVARPQPLTSAEAVEVRVRSWVAEFGLKAKAVSDGSAGAAYFALDVRLRDGRTVRVTEPRESNHYLVLETTISFAPQLRRMLGLLQHDQQVKVIRDVTIGLAESKLGFKEMLGFDSITVQKRVPITDSLTERDFIDAVNEVDNAEFLVVSTVLRDIGQ